MELILENNNDTAIVNYLSHHGVTRRARRQNLECSTPPVTWKITEQFIENWTQVTKKSYGSLAKISA